MFALRREMSAWIARSIARNSRIPWQGGHDEGTFTSSWFGFYQLTGDEQIADFLYSMRDGFFGWAKDNLRHGYYRTGEPHHQPETFMIFLTRLLHLDWQHQPTIEAIEHAAHHLGNWVDGIPDWYDWQTHRFLSYSLGTETVDTGARNSYEVPDHFRLLQVLITAHLATKQERYLELCGDYADRWAALILAEEDYVPAKLPAEIVADDAYWSGPGLPEPQSFARMAERLRANAGEKLAANVEMHVSAGTVDTLLDLFELCGKQLYVEAAKKLLGFAIPALSDPYALPPGSLLLKYRKVTGDTTFDEEALRRIGEMPDEAAPLSDLMFTDTKEEEHPMGIGRRRDAVRWGYRREDDTIVEERCASPTALVLAYDITGDAGYLARALAKSALRIAMARATLKDGRDHGCAGATVSAVASGHGRACGIGNVTGVLYPAAFGSYRFCNAEKLQVRYYDANGKLGLPENVAARVTCSNERERTLELWNDTSVEVPLKVGVENTNAEIASVFVDGKPTDAFEGSLATVRLAAERACEVRVLLDL